jgi:hypothetical protein
VSQSAVGAAVAEIREAAAAAAGRPAVAEYHRALAQHGPDELPHLRALVTVIPGPRRSLDDNIVTVLVGIAVRRGEPWEPLLALTTGGAAPSPIPVGPLHP